MIRKKRGIGAVSISRAMRFFGKLLFAHVSICVLSLGSGVQADENQDLAKQLANPIASLISVPFQGNYDTSIGANEAGDRLTVNVQPVVPIPLSDDWNMISRTILPITYQDSIFSGSGEQFGLGDTTQSLFFSPVETGPSGIIWGAGPVFLAPTGTEALLSSGKWGAGPTAVGLKQSPGASSGDTLTVGALANHIWSFAGSDRTSEISNTFMQPFLSYSTYNGYTFSLNTETSYNWTADEWSVPINVSVSKLTTIGMQPVSLFLGGRWWAESPTAGPEDFGIRFGITFLFPAGGQIR
jgi:hypothetical protein